MLSVPFGYVRNNVDKSIVNIEEKEAVIVRRIFDLYLQGKSCKRRISTIWSDGIISDILKNDFYIGYFRLHKRARGIINGADKRVAKEKQKETALEVIDNIIDKGSIDRRDVEILVEKIIVDLEGMPAIELKYGLSGLVKYNPADELNKRENNMINVYIDTMSNRWYARNGS